MAGQAQPGHARLSASPNTFAGARLDRAGLHRRDEGWLAARAGDPGSRAVATTKRGVYLEEDEPARFPLARLAALPGAGTPVLLGLEEDGRALHAVDLEGVAADGALAPARLVGVREAAAELSPADAGLVAYASALLNWHRSHPRCSVCGNETEVREGGLLRACPMCGAHHHPRTDPVIIVLVTDGERLLLGRQPTWPPHRYSCLAGFVEPGESLEDAVVREVLEESGVRVRDPRYVSSQPWPFPSSLMFGFAADYEEGEPAPADEELEAVGWFTRAQLEEASQAERGGLLLPPPLAIARRLIDGWLAAPAG